jgi:hypothetical protein
MVRAMLALLMLCVPSVSGEREEEREEALETYALQVLAMV